MDSIETLQELTGKESGVINFGNGTYHALNWSSLRGMREEKC